MISLIRFDQKIEVGLPTTHTREQLIHRCFSQVESGVTPQQIRAAAMLTKDWSCSDICHLCRETAMIPVREMLSHFVHSPESRPEIIDTGLSCSAKGQKKIRPITYEDFQSAFSQRASSPKTSV